MEKTNKPCYARVVTGSVHDKVCEDNIIEFNGVEYTVGTDSDCAEEEGCVLNSTSFDSLRIGVSTMGYKFIAAVPGLAEYLNPNYTYVLVMYPEDGVPCSEIFDYVQLDMNP